MLQDEFAWFVLHSHGNRTNTSEGDVGHIWCTNCEAEYDKHQCWLRCHRATCSGQLQKEACQGECCTCLDTGKQSARLWRNMLQSFGVSLKTFEGYLANEWK